MTKQLPTALGSVILVRINNEEYLAVNWSVGSDWMMPELGVLYTKNMVEAREWSEVTVKKISKWRDAFGRIKRLRKYMNVPTGQNSFYINGFKNRYDSIDDLYGAEMATTLRKEIEE